MSGWNLPGRSKGYGAVSREYCVKHDRPKQLWVRELRRGARRLLRGEELPEELQGGGTESAPALPGQGGELANIRACFGRIPEYRAKNWTYCLSGLLTLVFCAVLSGKARGQRDPAECAEGLSQGQLRALRFRRNPKSGAIPAPGESTFFRLPGKVKPPQLERVLLDCQEKLLGPDAEQGKLVVIDGKVLRSSRGAQLVGAFCARTGRWPGTELVEDKSNEIPAMRTLLERSSPNARRLPPPRGQEPGAFAQQRLEPGHVSSLGRRVGHPLDLAAEEQTQSHFQRVLGSDGQERLGHPLSHGFVRQSRLAAPERFAFAFEPRRGFRALRQGRAVLRIRPRTLDQPRIRLPVPLGTLETPIRPSAPGPDASSRQPSPPNESVLSVCLQA